jgi:hypothetical protein
LELEDPQTVEYKFFSGNHKYVPTTKLSDEDTWNPDYWTKYELIHWTSLEEPEELFKAHWSEV